MKQNGISLTILVITIIVILILSSTVIITISYNQPVGNAKEAGVKSDFKTIYDKYQEEYSNLIYESSGKKEETIYEELQNVIPEEYQNELLVTEYGVAYVGEDEIRIEIAKEVGFYVGNPVEIIDAKIIASNAPLYYGKTVTNYVTGNTKIEETLDTENIDWQIFYSDGTNIYLIATNFIPKSICPAGRNKTAITANSNYKLSMNNLVNDYNGTVDITDERLQALNSSYFEYLSNNNVVSENSNAKALAYMMDISEAVWGSFAGEKADYAIAGPTIEMLFKSYSQKYIAKGIDYRAQVASELGYKISKDGGVSWGYWYDKMLDTSDSLYVIKETNQAQATWIASPSVADSQGRYVMGVRYNGLVDYYYYSGSYPGFRPLVCLNSSVTLKSVNNGFEIQ